MFLLFCKKQVHTVYFNMNTLAKHSTLLDNYNVRKSFPWDLENQIRQRKLPFNEEYIIIMDSFGRQTYLIGRRKDRVPKLCVKLKITGVNCNF